MAGWEERQEGRSEERDRRREGKTGSKITQRAHQTVCLFTHEPQARYSRVSVECQQQLPGQIQPQSLGEEGRQTPCKTASLATFPVIESLFKHRSQSDFNITHSLHISRPRGIQTRHQNVTAELSWYHSAVLLSVSFQNLSLSQSLAQ